MARNGLETAGARREVVHYFQYLGFGPLVPIPVEGRSALDAHVITNKLNIPILEERHARKIVITESGMTRPARRLT